MFNETFYTSYIINSIYGWKNQCSK